MDSATLNYLNSLNINLEEDLIIERIYDRYRWPHRYTNWQPSIEAINVDGSKIDDFFDLDSYINPDRVVSLYKSGLTLIISRAEFLTKEIHHMHQILSKIVGNPVNANIYVGRGKTNVSFPQHDHDYDVFVKNVNGSSRWIINGAERIVSNQDTVFLPAWTDHEVVEIIEPKLSITWNLIKYE